MVFLLQKCPELPHQGRLPDPRLTRDENEILPGILALHPVFLDTLIDSVQFLLAPHEKPLFLYRMLRNFLAQLENLIHQRLCFRFRLFLQILLKRQRKLLVQGYCRGILPFPHQERQHLSVKALVQE